MEISKERQVWMREGADALALTIQGQRVLTIYHFQTNSYTLTCRHLMAELNLASQSSRLVIIESASPDKGPWWCQSSRNDQILKKNSHDQTGIWTPEHRNNSRTLYDLHHQDPSFNKTFKKQYILQSRKNQSDHELIKSGK
jgi:hypothetical protein